MGESVSVTNNGAALELVAPLWCGGGVRGACGVIVTLPGQDQSRLTHPDDRRHAGWR